MIESNNEKTFIFVSFYTADEKLSEYEKNFGEKSKNRDKLIGSGTVTAKPGQLECLLVICSRGISANLWARKCWLVPMKSFSIAHLELLSRLLLSKLITVFIKAAEVEVKVGKVFCCSDSQIAIWWICQIGKKCGSVRLKIRSIKLERTSV